MWKDGRALQHTRRPRNPPLPPLAKPPLAHPLPPTPTVRAAAALTETDLDVTAMAPLGDRLLVRPREAETATAGGVLLTSGATSELSDARVGTVVAVGDDVEDAVTPGDTVLFVKYSASDVKTADGDVCFVAATSVLAKLET